MRVAMVTPFPRDPETVVGGVAGCARYLVPELARRVDLHVLAPGHQERRSRRWRGARIEYLPRVPGPGVLSYWTLERRSIGRSLEEVDPDVAHFQGIGGWAFGCPVPWVLTIHGLAELDVLHGSGRSRRIRSALIRRVETRARRAADAVVSISPYLRRSLDGQLPDRVFDIENPVADGFFEIERREDPGLVLFLGRIGPRKNTLGLIRAFEAVAEASPQARLVIAGDDEDDAYAERCRRVASAPLLAGRVSFPGPQPVRAVGNLLASAACLVLPSFQETAPLVVSEAMAAGVPVVASRRCGLPDLVRDRETGLLVDPASSDQVASAILELLRGPALREAMSARARREAGRFRSSVVAARTVEVYEVVAPGPPRLR